MNATLVEAEVTVIRPEKVTVEMTMEEARGIMRDLGPLTICGDLYEALFEALGDDL
jgi:hypothetical protein